MDKFCIVGVSIGNDYQSFIPIYIYSILQHYPEYSVLIFSDTGLSNNTKKMLEMISSAGNFEVVDNYRFGLDINQQLLNKRSYKQAIRFLFFDERFNQFETLYFGDIDIFICKEQGGIFGQHMKHCETINLPYSNYVRALAIIESVNLRKKALFLLSGNFKNFFQNFQRKIIVENRLTGLHFVKTKAYFEKIKPLFPYYIDIVTGNRKRNDLRRDEEILYDLVKNSGLGLPPISPNSADLDNTQSHSIAFNPLHGIHLGIFRSKYTQITYRQVLQSYIYKDYYQQFRTLLENGPILRELINSSNAFVKNQFDEMETYYEFSENHLYEVYCNQRF